MDVVDGAAAYLDIGSIKLYSYVGINVDGERELRFTKVPDSKTRATTATTNFFNRPLQNNN